ncbi:FecR family protein [Chitinophaga lutea]
MESQFNTAEDFLQDDSFLRYCMGAGEIDRQYWEQWRETHPAQQSQFDQAVSLFDTLHGRAGRLDEASARFRAMLSGRIAQEHAARTRIRRIRYRLAAAAGILLVVSAAAWLITSRQHKPAQTGAGVASVTNDIQPGGKKAKLVLGDGRNVALDSLSGNDIRESDGTQISVGKGGLVYDDGSAPGGAAVYNTLSTPRGGEYEITLPDGSHVWLNTASSLRFPTRFGKTDRTVYLTGEASFDVKGDASQPFIVQTGNGMKVTVLGTDFNVSAYEDDAAVQTTLVTGKVSVTAPSGKHAILLPSQQASLTAAGLDFKITEVDTDKILAWKSGMFEFDDDDITAVMKQLSRWYDVDVKYTGTIPAKHYTGSFPRLSTLSQALQILKTAGIKFSIEGRQIVVGAQ